jgi:integrase
MANGTKHVLHTMWKWAKQPDRKFVTVNPVADLDAPGGKRISRERFLSADEIRTLWRALNTPAALGITPDVATALRLILATAARPGMVAGMHVGELHDLSGPSAHGPHWALPAERMKADAAFTTPLNGIALELIRPHLAAKPTGRLFALGRNALHEAAQSIVTKLAMVRWTPHDLRRTAATILDDQKYSLEEIGALLAHTRKGVTAVYARSDKRDLKREMATVLERAIEAAAAAA